MSNRVKLAVGAVGLIVVAVLAFGVFGVHTLFIDDEVSEGIPVFTAGSESGMPSDEVTEDMAAEMNDVMQDEGISAQVEVTETEPPMEEPEIIRLIEGSFVDRSHPGTGTAVVLTDADGTQRFLRLEEDFETDNGPDLNVYLVAGVDANGDAGLFDDDFFDLGDLKGNIGSQNYEIPDTVDLDRYTTVVVWCVRFGVAFTAADLA